MEQRTWLVKKVKNPKQTYSNPPLECLKMEDQVEDVKFYSCHLILKVWYVIHI